MNRTLRKIFLGLAVLLALHAVLFANYLRVIGGDVLRAKLIWAELLGAVFFIVAGLRFSVGAKFKIFSVVLVFALVEFCLQAAAWLGVLPVVNTKINVPFSRVYWTGEGLGNSIRNRYGWYYKAFDLNAAHRIAYVGDSQVEAVEIPPDRNQAADLQALLRARSPDWAVYGLGSHGTCPAHSIEVLDYAARHFHPTEAILVISIGSDVADASPILNGAPPSSYIYYDLSPEGKLVLNPGSVVLRQRYVNVMELNARSPWITLPMMIYSHCMTIQFLDSVRDHMALRRRQAELAARAAGMAGKEGEEFGRLGFNPLPFALNPDAESRRAMAVLLAQIRECKAVCDRQGMTMRMVTVPTFPQVFYETQHGTNWSLHIGDYDYLKPEREITEWAGTNGVPVLALGEMIESQHPDVEEVRSLYLSNGMGHLSEKGHLYCARAVLAAFYPAGKP